MLESFENRTPRTTTDIVFERLHQDILSLKLRPGTRISEADVASKLGVSRQPVRDAFNRLGNLNLLNIRPQRATIVRGFNIEKISNARFVRLAIELEMARQLQEAWSDECEIAVQRNLEAQKQALDQNDIDGFHALDYDFHKLLFDLSGRGMTFNDVLRCKQQVDRLCVLSLARENEINEVLSDHEAIAAALAGSSFDAVEAIFRQHLSRLDDVIKDIHKKHQEYFE